MKANTLLNAIESGSLEAVDGGDMMYLFIDKHEVTRISYGGQRSRATVGFDGLSVDVYSSLDAKDGFSIECETREDASRIAEAIDYCFECAMVDV